MPIERDEYEQEFFLDQEIKTLKTTQTNVLVHKAVGAYYWETYSAHEEGCARAAGEFKKYEELTLNRKRVKQALQRSIKRIKVCMGDVSWRIKEVEKEINYEKAKLAAVEDGEQEQRKEEAPKATQSAVPIIAYTPAAEMHSGLFDGLDEVSQDDDSV
eukprot:TRINITY_DN11121_c4_g1_i1.p1 TRINITY_DN11121_c4_g1~~TRINITY_DN11121_c4_g1_i1.p1  ORF type:complete len:172 (+),score=46.64 TRINITY_DN11121_c4_g1_i1:44-517(+)